MGKRERESDKKKQVIVSVALSLLMILSVFGVMIGSFGNNEMRYGKFKFEVQNNQYVTKINNQEMAFYFLPIQTDYINLSSSVTNKLKESYMIMTTFDPSDALNIQIMEVVRFDLAQTLGKVVVPGVLNQSADYAEVPIVTCANATLQTPVIVLTMSDNTSIEEVDNCIYFKARGTEFLRLRDRLLYSYYGVIQDAQ